MINLLFFLTSIVQEAHSFVSNGLSYSKKPQTNELSLLTFAKEEKWLLQEPIFQQFLLN